MSWCLNLLYGCIQVFKEEEEAIKVDLHEGCGRTKLFWLMALADSKTMKAMVEFREHTGKVAVENTPVPFWVPPNGFSLCSDDRCVTGKPASSSSDACRFCGTRNGTELSAVGSVCSDPDCQVTNIICSVLTRCKMTAVKFSVVTNRRRFLSCLLPQEYAKLACSKTHPCGHPCGGVKNEESCLPCLHGCDKNTGCLKQDADDMCMICFTEALSAAPAVQVTLRYL